jgi:hypothetical protein
MYHMHEPENDVDVKYGGEEFFSLNISLYYLFQQMSKQ